jgi:hypothetical protein
LVVILNTFVRDENKSGNTKCGTEAEKSSAAAWYYWEISPDGRNDTGIDGCSINHPDRAPQDAKAEKPPNATNYSTLVISTERSDEKSPTAANHLMRYLPVVDMTHWVVRTTKKDSPSCQK